ncbi:hypothetical protein EPN44_06675 [bacterium]|nr:MAG: hypothetical protein EPN44_06675 [bacterium]
MRKLVWPVGIAVALLVMPFAASSAQGDLPLARVAHQSGMSYAWLGVERAVSLTRKGLVIVVRPGANEYEVNDRVEVAAQAPRYAAGDLYVSPVLAKRIETLARSAAKFAASAPRVREAGAAMPRTGPLSGQLAIEAQPLAGREAIVVNGQAPQGAPVTITLFGTLSSDLPTVVLSRHDVQADVNGRFQAVIPIASDYVRGSILHVVATSAPGVSPASAQLIVGPPNPQVSVPAEQASHEVW